MKHWDTIDYLYRAAKKHGLLLDNTLYCADITPVTGIKSVTLRTQTVKRFLRSKCMAPSWHLSQTSLGIADMNESVLFALDICDINLRWFDIIRFMTGIALNIRLTAPNVFEDMRGSENGLQFGTPPLAPLIYTVIAIATVHVSENTPVLWRIVKEWHTK